MQVFTHAINQSVWNKPGCADQTCTVTYKHTHTVIWFAWMGSLLQEAQRVSCSVTLGLHVCFFQMIYCCSFHQTTTFSMYWDGCSCVAVGMTVWRLSIFGSCSWLMGGLVGSNGDVVSDLEGKALAIQHDPCSCPHLWSWGLSKDQMRWQVQALVPLAVWLGHC